MMSQNIFIIKNIFLVKFFTNWCKKIEALKETSGFNSALKENSFRFPPFSKENLFQISKTQCSLFLNWTIGSIFNPNLTPS